MVNLIIENEHLISRDYITFILSEIESDITIDFINVIFISRASTDQLYQENALLEYKGYKVTFINMCEQVSLILEAVSKTQINPRKDHVHYEVKKFDNNEDLYDYMMSL